MARQIESELLVILPRTYGSQSVPPDALFFCAPLSRQANSLVTTQPFRNPAIRSLHSKLRSLPDWAKPRPRIDSRVAGTQVRHFVPTTHFYRRLLAKESLQARGPIGGRLLNDRLRRWRRHCAADRQQFCRYTFCECHRHAWFFEHIVDDYSGTNTSTHSVTNTRA
jgi:hypothetical protein